MDPLLKQRLLGLRAFEGGSDIDREVYKVSKRLKGGYITILKFAAQYGLTDVFVHLVYALGSGFTDKLMFEMIGECVQHGHVDILHRIFDRINTDRRLEILRSLDWVSRCPEPLCKVFNHDVFARYTTSTHELRMKVLLFLSECHGAEVFNLYNYFPNLRICADDLGNGNFLKEFSEMYNEDYVIRIHRRARPEFLKAIVEAGVDTEADIREIFESGHERGLELLITLDFPMEYGVWRFHSYTYSDLDRIYLIPFSVFEPSDEFVAIKNFERYDGGRAKHLSHPFVSARFFSEYNAQVDLFNADLAASKRNIHEKLFKLYLYFDGRVEQAMKLDAPCTDKWKMRMIILEPHILTDWNAYAYFRRHGLSVNIHDLVVLFAPAFGHCVRDSVMEKFANNSIYSKKQIDRARAYCDIAGYDYPLHVLDKLEKREYESQRTKDEGVRVCRTFAPEDLVRAIGDFVSADGYYCV